MTPEEKQLLIKDLCARLPYGIKCKLSADRVSLVEDLQLAGLSQFLYGRLDVIPYLRPMSSMTEEEFKEYHNMLIDVDNSGLMNQELITKIVDWLDKKMFDHRNLIPKDLALEAKEDMYK